MPRRTTAPRRPPPGLGDPRVRQPRNPRTRRRPHRCPARRPRDDRGPRRRGPRGRPGAGAVRRAHGVRRGPGHRRRGGRGAPWASRGAPTESSPLRPPASCPSCGTRRRADRMPRRHSGGCRAARRVAGTGRDRAGCRAAGLPSEDGHRGGGPHGLTVRAGRPAATPVSDPATSAARPSAASPSTTSSCAAWSWATSRSAAISWTCASTASTSHLWSRPSWTGATRSGR